MTIDALSLIDAIATAPSLDQITALPPKRFREKATRDALVKRLRGDRVAWEVKRGDRSAPVEEGAEE